MTKRIPMAILIVTLLSVFSGSVVAKKSSEGKTLSVEQIVNKIKQFSNKTILEEFSALKGRLAGHPGIWDQAYFVETIGR